MIGRAAAALVRSGFVVLVGMLCVPAWQIAAAQPSRGVALTEERVALVIGNAAYRENALDNPLNDARLVASSLQRADFKVTLRENLDRPSLLIALREFGNLLNENTVAVLYYAGHGLQLRDRNYLIPVDAEIRSEDEIPVSGIDLSFILGRMAAARSRINIVILDACRNNPFAGKTVSAPSGLAQMDAPVGTLLAFATAPGKLALDSGTGSAANSLYASYLAKHLLTPGLPVESVFKRVREGVVRDTQRLQVPWESSSLQGEFAFVPGTTATAGESTREQEAAGELAYWSSIQNSSRADEYRAYLRQYPEGRFASLAQTRVAAFTPGPSPVPIPPPATPASTPRPTEALAATTSPTTARPDLLPRAGDTWRYRVQDQFRLGDLYVTARVNEVTAEGVAETWTTTSDAKVRTSLTQHAPGFNALPDWTLAPPEFAPYLLATGTLRPGQRIGEQQRRIDQVVVPIRVSVEGEEDITVAAGRYRAVKVVLRGRAEGQARGASKAAPVQTEQVVWYAPEVKRIVKQTISTHVGNTLREATSFELTVVKLN
jgi:uncharacterized caspase-like protein